jgi:hypothetical protein
MQAAAAVIDEHRNRSVAEIGSERLLDQGAIRADAARHHVPLRLNLVPSGRLGLADGVEALARKVGVKVEMHHLKPPYFLSTNTVTVRLLWIRQTLPVFVMSRRQVRDYGHPFRGRELRAMGGPYRLPGVPIHLRGR